MRILAQTRWRNRFIRRHTPMKRDGRPQENHPRHSNPYIRKFHPHSQNESSFGPSTREISKLESPPITIYHCFASIFRVSILLLNIKEINVPNNILAPSNTFLRFHLHFSSLHDRFCRYFFYGIAFSKV